MLNDGRVPVGLLHKESKGRRKGGVVAILGSQNLKLLLQEKRFLVLSEHFLQARRTLFLL
jgi:hypothetical protein